MSQILARVFVRDQERMLTADYTLDSATLLSELFERVRTDYRLKGSTKDWTFIYEENLFAFIEPLSAVHKRFPQTQADLLLIHLIARTKSAVIPAPVEEKPPADESRKKTSELPPPIPAAPPPAPTAPTLKPDSVFIIRDDTDLRPFQTPSPVVAPGTAAGNAATIPIAVEPPVRASSSGPVKTEVAREEWKESAPVKRRKSKGFSWGGGSGKSSPLVTRLATVRYFYRMNPLRSYPLLVVLSSREIQDIVKKGVKQA